MAVRRSAHAKRRVKFDEHVADHAPKGDWRALVAHAQQNPVMWAAAAGLVLVGVLAGVLFRINTRANEEAIMTRYAQALDNTDPALRAAALEELTASKGAFMSEVVYMWGESSLDAGQYDKAKAAFERVRSEHPNSKFTPDAVEGLGFVAEATGDLDTAMTRYTEVSTLWPGSFAAQRQQFNLGRCYEAQGKLPEAIAAYQAQLSEMPGTYMAQNAQDELARLRALHPEAFPEEATPAAAEATAPEAAPAGEVVLTPEVIVEDAAESPAASETTPAADAPATEEPAAPPADAAPTTTETPAAP